MSQVQEEYHMDLILGRLGLLTLLGRNFECQAFSKVAEDVLRTQAQSRMVRSRH